MNGLEELIQQWVLSDVPHRLVVVHLYHARPRTDASCPIPGVGLSWSTTRVLKDVVYYPLEQVLFNPRPHHHITARLKFVAYFIELLHYALTLWLIWFGHHLCSQSFSKQGSSLFFL